MGLTLPGAGILDSYCTAADVSGFYQNVNVDFDSAIDSNQDTNLSGNIIGGSAGFSYSAYTNNENIFVVANGSAHYGSGQLEDGLNNKFNANAFGFKLEGGPKMEFDLGNNYSSSSTFVLHPYAFLGMDNMTIKDAISANSPIDGSPLTKDINFMSGNGVGFGYGARSSLVMNKVAITAAAEKPSGGDPNFAARVGFDMTDQFNVKCGYNTVQVFLQGGLSNATSTVDLGQTTLGNAEAQTWNVGAGMSFNF